MKKAIIIIAILAGFFAVLGFGALVGGGLTYLALRARPVLAAELNQKPIQISSGIDRDQGILVSSVVSGSPADQAGIVRGDIIIAVNDISLTNLNELMKALQDYKAGDDITLTVLHGDDERQITIPLTETDNLATIGILPCSSMGLPFMSDKLGQGFMLPSGGTQGVVIQEVLEDTPAQTAELLPDDIILAVNEREINQDTDFASLLMEYEPGDTVILTVKRAGNDEPIEVEIVLGEHPEDPSQPYLGIRYRPTSGLIFKDDGQIPFDQLPFDLPEGDNFPFQLPEGEGQPWEMPFFEQQPHNFVLPEGVDQAVLIVEVVPGTAAEEAGLLTNDLITELDGEPVVTPELFAESIQSLKPGDKVELTVYREGNEKPVQVTVMLGENPDAKGQPYLGVAVSGMIQIQSETAPGQDSFFGPGFPFPLPKFESPIFGEPGESA